MPDQRVPSHSRPQYTEISVFNDWEWSTLPERVDDYVRKHGLLDHVNYFQKGAMLNRKHDIFQSSQSNMERIRTIFPHITFSQTEVDALTTEYPSGKRKRFDRRHFKQSRTLYILVALCSAAAAGNVLRPQRSNQD